MDMKISEKVIGIWWGIIWRGACIGFVIGFVLGAGYAMLGGSVKDPLFNLLLLGSVWTYGTMLSIKWSLKANNIDVEKAEALRLAVISLYTAAHWTADRDVPAERLWEEVRDAAGILPGNSPKKIER